VFYSNSNITPREEYDIRLNECIRYAKAFDLEIVADEYDHSAWGACAIGLETEPERGARCLQCFKFRLLRAAQYAATHGFDVLTTTLASSRWKSLEQVNEAGQWACAQVEGVVWWPQNWRKGGLQERRGEIIREQNFYNQLFCGCEFSRR
jgi:predicted adenine nucleotide alpha hydrolase (AANH) superfamily ATPase